ncbi:uncharacterized protein LOC127435433 [Myxocyprinus asiaticus]|uniref:uncharacterized protein LOC127435433 n=1 Tax=Myxocyprinus asiaticus TaxID=70543 RepID=UPI002221BC78|nr:uncharacterized protein LOC127435433 [Myxocyprinus asiaticus]
MKKDLLKTPSTEEKWRTKAHNFESKWQFPHCLGALDGKHPYTASSKKWQIYHNYKARFSVIMMAAVDVNYKFIYASVGTQDRVSDAGLFAHSDLCKAMDQGLLNFPLREPLPNCDITMPYMFLGDEAYPLRPNFMKPYPYRQMDHSQQVLNYRL